MGNRAVVTVEGSKIGVYLHWNGGRESVQAFLRAAKDLGVRSPGYDDSYFYARFAQIVGNYFGGALSVGIGELSQLDTDNSDNGTFVIGDNFEILRQEHAPPGGGARSPDPGYEQKIYENVMACNKAHFAKEG